MVMSSLEWQVMVTGPLGSSLKHLLAPLRWQPGQGGHRRGPERDNGPFLGPRQPQPPLGL